MQKFKQFKFALEIIVIVLALFEFFPPLGMFAAIALIYCLVYRRDDNQDI